MKEWRSPLYKNAFQYVRHLTAHYSKSFYAATRMLPEETRWATYALYGFCRYADNLIDLPRDRSPVELISEVDFLRQELTTGYRTGESEHPILQPFILTAQKYDIPMEYPLELLKGVEMDLQKNRYQNFSELYLFAYRVAGVVGLMMTHVLGYHDKAAFQYAEKLGIAMQLTNILRDVQEDKNMGRIYLPQEELQAFGVSEEGIMMERWNPQMCQLMQFQLERAERYYQEAQPGIALLNPETRFAIAAASRIYGGVLEKIRQNNFNPFLGRVFLSKNEKLKILGREWLRIRNPFHRLSSPDFQLPSLSHRKLNNILVEEK
jgi:phytoene synthase